MSYKVTKKERRHYVTLASETTPIGFVYYHAGGGGMWCFKNESNGKSNDRHLNSKDEAIEALINSK